MALPERTKVCAFCHHSERYHNKEADPSPQMPCSKVDTDPVDETPVQCLCYGWCETKEEADAISSEPIIGPISGYEVYLMAQEKEFQNAKKAKVILFKPSGKYYCEEEWRIPEMVPVPDTNRMRKVVGPYDMEFSPDFHRISGGAVLIESQEPWGYPHLFPGSSLFSLAIKAEQSQSYPPLEPDNITDGCANCPHVKGRHYRGGTPYCEPANGKCNCPGFAIRVSQSPSYCKCGHLLIAHVDDDNECGECSCIQFTRAEQFSSYSKSAQSEPEPQYAEHQSSFRSQCKYRHVHIAGDLLVHMVNTLKSGHQAMPETMKESLSHISLALLTCEEVECRAFRILVEQALSSLFPASLNCLRTNTEFLKQSEQFQQPGPLKNSDQPLREA